MPLIRNPILPGFNPDPSVIRVGEDYYIATSTFEWFPGVQIHHSRDLVHWQVITHPLSRTSQLDMTGNPDSGGVWAPCLSYHEGTYYLVYTDVKSHMGPFKDTHNYVVTAQDIRGPWSEPVYLNSSGFDPSLFHEEDGSKWVVNLTWDHRKGRNPFGGIVIQEYSEERKELVGPIRKIFDGTSLGLTEGPHIYRANGYYYLLTAEGGTRLGHAATVARAKTLFGPYEADPSGPLLTSRDQPELALQKAGHACLLETPQDGLYIVHLCGRPLRPSGSCTLGRETAIQKCEWTEDGWLALAGGGSAPEVLVEGPQVEEHIFEEEPETEHFTGGAFSIHLHSLRGPVTEDWATVNERPGFLRVYGRESLYSKHKQSLIARRQQSFGAEAETALEFAPESYQQMAGLVYYYNTNNYYYLFLSRDEQAGLSVGIMSSSRGVYDEPLAAPVSTQGWTRCHLKAVIDHESLQFYYSKDAVEWQPVGGTLDAATISDENAEWVKDGFALDQGFTGAFLGICVQDLSGRRLHADFDYFTYRETGHITDKDKENT
ncbi:glycoside hydrolase family 43 protein [Paenibacillus sp. MMS20-IR301]|uniref:glycoside hydrolase family 43 protein n=1 Tax=Paenibacillus sp. MMS20-IR301 TaxID=2895946 RepID=UPI0028E5CC3B|nr:glycoside hydrolase family 43 protein [Paenibacillus sp. MMS20-IR301]WNS41913.1 glycoside hydrolase family 43 protein [Paenibacillus sp. MMS20-IR301]